MIAFAVQVPKKLQHIAGIQELFDAIEVAKSAKDPYAKSYIDGIDRAIDEYGAKGLKVQLLYVASNLGYWRGDKARQTKATFKKWDKILEKYARD